MSDTIETTSLEGALSSTSTPTTEATPAVTEPAAPTTPAESAADPATPSETPGEGTGEGENWERQAKGYKTGMFKERAKRQELEQLVESLSSSKTTTPQPVQTAPQAAAVPSYYEDPELFVKSQVGMIAQDLTQKFATATEMIARSAHPDYDDKFAAFVEVAKKDPALYQEIMASANPGEAAYQAGKQALFQKEYGNDEASILKRAEEKLRPTIEQKVKAELLGKAHDKTNQPTSLSQARSAGGGGAAEWRPSSLKDLVG